MFSRRVEFFVMLGLLLIVNFFTLLWLQNRPFASVLANASSAPSAPQAVASMPNTFSFQGTVRDAEGALLTGQVTLTLKIYTEVLGGTALHSEVFTLVPVRDGLFSVVVGDQAGNAINPAIFENATLFLGIAVNDDAEMLPRQRLHPVPWARQASIAQRALEADNADNLVQGGGVPGSIQFGASGAKEIAFAQNAGDPTTAGKISYGTNAMTLRGPGANGVVQVNGSLVVDTGVSVGNGLSITGGITNLTGGISMTGNFRIDGAAPILIKRFENKGDNAYFDTDVSSQSYDCVTGGFLASYDPRECCANPNGAWAHVGGNGNWHVRAEFNSEASNENPDVDLLCFRRELTDYVGNRGSNSP